MHTDSYFAIGYSHLTGGKPCQDYATAALLPEGAAYAIVADGCSTGGQTDVGARILALSTAQAIREHWSTTRTTQEVAAVERITLQQRMVATTAQSVLGCDSSDMLSTCLYAYLAPAGGFVHIQGDGVVAWQHMDGRITMTRLDWADNAPFYPVYANDGYAEFVRYHGGNVDANRLTSETWEYRPDGSCEPTDNRDYTLGEGIRGTSLFLPADDLRVVAVFTDGVTQIESVDWKDAVVQLLSFKATRGAFAKRRMMRVVKDARQLGNGPLDDLAYAVIYVESEEAA
jgi:hypothetical protein